MAAVVRPGLQCIDLDFRRVVTGNYCVRGRIKPHSERKNIYTLVCKFSFDVHLFSHSH